MTTISPVSVRRLAMTHEMTIYRAAEQKEQLIGALDGADQLELDLAGVPEIDTAGLQLLILLKQEAARRHVELRIVAHSEAVRAVIDFCHLPAVFGDPMVIPAA